MIVRALAVFRGAHLRFFAYPDDERRRCVVCLERDGSDVLQVLVKLDGPILDAEDEHRLEQLFFAAPEAGAVH